MLIEVSNNEYKVLSAIWAAGRPLTAAEIVERLRDDKAFRDRTIHSILTVMLDKGVIYVDGQKRSTRTYSRCFNTRLGFEEYHSAQIMQNATYRKNKGNILTGIFSALIDDADIQPDALEELEKLIEEKKRSLEHEADDI